MRDLAFAFSLCNSVSVLLRRCPQLRRLTSITKSSFSATAHRRLRRTAVFVFLLECYSQTFVILPQAGSASDTLHLVLAPKVIVILQQAGSASDIAQLVIPNRGEAECEGSRLRLFSVLQFLNLIQLPAFQGYLHPFIDENP